MGVSMAEAAFDAVRQIDNAAALPAIHEQVRTFAAPLGYDRFVMFSATAAPADAVERIYWAEGDWFAHGEVVDAESYVRHCPMTHHVLQTRTPFFWTKTAAPQGERYRVVRLPRGSGIHGLQIPVFGPAGLEGAISLGGERTDASRQAQLALTLVATAAFMAARRLLEPPREAASSMLSHREREVLTWVSAGRRQADVAAVLGLSERTVENHLRRIRKRLSVATTAQAVRVALRNGDLSD